MSKYGRWKKFQFSMFCIYDVKKSFFSQPPCQFLKRHTKWPILEPLTVAKNLKYSYWPGQGTTVPPTKVRVKGSSQTFRATQTENEEEVISQKDGRQTKNKQEQLPPSLKDHHRLISYNRSLKGTPSAMILTFWCACALVIPSLSNVG